MSGIGSSEFILLLIIGLIVLGPKRLPEVANKIGGWIGQARRMTRVMKRQLEDELSIEQNRIMQPPARPMTGSAPPAADDIAAHVPSDDDTYSPLHDEAADEPEPAVTPAKEQDA